jgi:L-asparaginase II
VTGALTAEGSVELAVLERSGMVESRHLGAAVVVSPDGEILRALGDPTALVYPRSTLKLLQAVAVLRAGAPLAGERLALASASHAGTPEHIRVVHDILGLAGLSDEDLGCPSDWPGDPASRAAVVAAGGHASPVYMNCSGKHAAFLVACRRSGWSIEDYLSPGHPLQDLILATVEEFTGETVVHSGVDGCGAPVHAVSLAGLARGIGRVARAEEPETALLSSAILANPWAIDGPGRANTITVQTLGILAKLGAEGVMVMAASDGTAVAVKILDGSLRAATLVALELLVEAGAVARSGADEVLAATLEGVTGGGVTVGGIRVVFDTSTADR